MFAPALVSRLRWRWVRLPICSTGYEILLRMCRREYRDSRALSSQDARHLSGGDVCHQPILSTRWREVGFAS